MRVAFIVAVAVLVAGCTTPETAGPTPVAEDLAGPRVLDNGRVALDVPVDVVLFGFAPNVVANLRAELTPVTADHQVIAPVRDAPKSEAEAMWMLGLPDTAPANGIVPRAVFRVHAAPEALAAELRDVATAEPDADGLLNATRLEAWLAANLHRAGFTPDKNRTALVVLDTGERGHGYRYHGNVGWRAPVRTFGERYGFVAWDPFAAADPWVGAGAAHHRPVSGDPVPVIAEWVERATHIRALQMPVFPPPLKGCHAVTILFAVRGTTVTPQALGLLAWEDAIAPDRLQSHFSELVSGEPVFVDLVVKQLPADDPALEAATREHGTRASMYQWLDANYEAYHVPHEGCEPYLSFVVYGDFVDQRTVSNGVASYYHFDGRRTSFSVVSELTRFQTEFFGYDERTDELSNFDRVGAGAHPHEWFNWVVSHETGHLFGQAHPNYADVHSEDGASGGTLSDPAFASTWNVMGYQMRRSTTDFGQVDDTNLARNRAGWAVREAALLDRTDDPAFDAALTALGEFRWQDALVAVRPLLEARA